MTLTPASSSLRAGVADAEKRVGADLSSLTRSGVEPADMARFWAVLDYHVYAITGQQLSEVEFDKRVQVRDIWDYVAVPAESGALNRRIHQVLNQPRVNWLAVRAQLNHANDHAAVGAAERGKAPTLAM